MQQKLNYASHSEPDISSNEPCATFSQTWWHDIGHHASSRDIVGQGKMNSFVPKHCTYVSFGNQTCKPQAKAVLDEEKATIGKDGKSDEEHQQMQLGVSSMPSTLNEVLAPPTQLELADHSMACASYLYSGSYYGAAIPGYVLQPLVQPHGLGLNSARMVVPLEMTEEPVYVNAKQYHGILRRRQSRAKAELAKKLIKVRKPYLHESRHLHAMRRARSCGGRFLATKKPDVTSAASTTTNENTAISDPKTLFNFAESISSSQEILLPHQEDMRSSTNGSKQHHSQVQGFELSGYQSLSGDTGIEGDWSGQHSKRPNFTGVRRALTIK